MSKFEIAELNTGFDGGLMIPDSTGKILGNWRDAHQFVLRARDIDGIQKLQSSQDVHPVKQLLENNNRPPFIVLTEVMPNMHDGSQAKKALEQANYRQILTGTNKPGDTLRRTTLIASLDEKGVRIDFNIPERTGGGSVGVVYPDSKLAILGVHLSAFNPLDRWNQLFYVFRKVLDLTRQEYNVVLTGDFNTEYKGLYRLLFEKLPLQHISEISFPPDKLAEEALEKPGLEGVILNNVLKKKKSYDHIHIPESW